MSLCNERCCRAVIHKTLLLLLLLLNVKANSCYVASFGSIIATVCYAGVTV